MTSIKESIMTRHEQEMYKNIERIATALEKLVAQGKDEKLDKFKKASNLLYGNDNMNLVKEGQRDSSHGLLGGNLQDVHMRDSITPTDNTSMDSFQPTITSDLDAYIHKASQQITGGQFKEWYMNLTGEEKQSYARVYGND